MPSLTGSGLLTTNLRTSSSLDRLNNFLILLARFGPRRRGNEVSVKPGMSFSPVMMFKRTWKSILLETVAGGKVVEAALVVLDEW